MSKTSLSTKSYITVNKNISEAYAYWRKLENLPTFLKHIDQVTQLTPTLSQWVASIPGTSKTIQWQSEIVAEQENESMQWKSLPGSDIQNKGIVQFKGAGKFGTEVHVEIKYEAPIGAVAHIAEDLIKYLTDEYLKEDLKDFRRLIETGEIPTIKGQASGNNK